MTTKRVRAAILAAVVAAAVAAPVMAQGLMGADAVDKRQELMRSNGKTLKAMQTATGADAVTYAQTLVDNFAALGPLWPDDSQNVPGTEALPAVWTDMETFQADMTAAAKLLADAKAGDAMSYKADLKVMGGTCGSCHQQFRAN